ncbi:MAG TPA: hypothetical protein PKI59_06570 [Candidatus Cloacimonadota bacterium]|nr:hypothetical protein [Candidatus Cloacimonadota bacterium]
MKRYIIIILCLAALGLGAEIHSAAGTYGYKYLNIPVCPASMALAGRGIHSGSNAAAFINQPAVSSIESGRSAGFGHSLWLADTAFSTLYYTKSKRTSAISLVLRNLNYGEVEKRDETGYLIGHYNPADISLMGNYSWRFSPAIYMGINLGGLYQKLDTASSMAVHSDAGITFLPPLADSRFSMSLRNFGNATNTKEVYSNFAYSWEMDFYKGLEVAGQHLGVEISALKTADEAFKYAASAELKMLQKLYLRSGYKLGYDAENFTAGIGVEAGSFQIDYGFAAYTDGLNDVHSFGLRYHF